ncbi:MAG: hypothetical protein U9R41_02380 [Candidatus Marinimicrobia bacterium]|nr:hypothetical protein [Candidatus Neomarinimicrobiota bacterium]
MKKEKLFELIGQEKIYSKLTKFIEREMVSTGYLFAGPPGSGKISMALNFAAALNCEDPKENLACGECNSCKKIKQINHPNLQIIFATIRGKNPKDDDPLAGLSNEEFEEYQDIINNLKENPYSSLKMQGAKQILISNIRKIKKDLLYSKIEFGWRVIIINLAEQLGIEAFNSILKILEEPPSQTVFVLTTEKLSIIPSTIRSRCQVIKFNPIPEEKIAEYLNEKDIDDSAKNRIARLSNGNMRKVKELMTRDFSEEDAKVLNFWRLMMGSKIGNKPSTMIDLTELVNEYSKLAKTDYNEFINKLQLILFWLRDAQIIAAEGSDELLINSYLLNELTKFANYYQKFSYEKIINLVEETIEFSSKNVYIPALLGRLFFSIREELRNAK